MQAEEFDAIIIGAGRAGVPLAKQLAGGGLRTALVDARFGASPAGRGASPGSDRVVSKSLAATSRVAGLLRRAADFGIECHGGPAMDFERVMIRSDDLSRATDVHDWLELFKTPRLTLKGGYASFAARDQIVIVGSDGAAERATAPRIFINTGTRVSIPDLPGLDTAGYLTTETIWKLSALPEHLIVLGGGALGVEFAQVFRRLGSRVTIVQRNSRLLPREDPDMSAIVASVLRRDGVDVVTDAVPTAVERVPGDDPRKPAVVVLSVWAAGMHTSISGSDLLVAAGRAPNSGTLSAHKAGIELRADGSVVVDDRLVTSVDGVWALGDVTGTPSSAALARDDCRIVTRNILGDGMASRAGRLAGTAVFVDPPFAAVGLREHEADRAPGTVRVVTASLDRVQSARDHGDTTGLVKFIREGTTDRIVGFSMIGPGACEVAGAMQIAIAAGVPAARLGKMLFAQPSIFDVFTSLSENDDAHA